MVTPLMSKAIVILGLISVVFLGTFLWITEQGMFGYEEEHVVTVEWKKHEFYWDSGCWNDFFADDKDNIYNTDWEIYTKIQPGHKYYIKTGKRSLLNGRWYAYYIEELPRTTR